MSAAVLAERQLIGCVLWSAHGGAGIDHLTGMISGLVVEDLTDPDLRRVLETIQMLLIEGRTPVPAVIVPTMLDLGLLTNQLHPVTTGLVCKLVQEAPAVVMWPELKRTILEWSARRRVAQAGMRLQRAAGNVQDVADLRELVAVETTAARDALAVAS